DRGYAWRAEVAAHLPHLSGPEATVLALWSFGMVLAGACGRTAVGTVLAAGLGCGEGALRQRLREWCYAAADKRGGKRRELAVEGCFGPLLGWVLSWWDGTQLALALDATTLGGPLRGAGGQRRLPRLRDPGGLGGAAGQHAPGVAARVAAAAAAAR